MCDQGIGLNMVLLCSPEKQYLNNDIKHVSWLLGNVDSYKDVYSEVVAFVGEMNFKKIV